MNREDWNARYASSDLVWGAEPNRFVVAELGSLAPQGWALDVACGEGRNAIWLAGRSWTVTAVDFSDVALERGRRLAAGQGVRVEWVLDDVTAFEPEPGAFALVLVAYLQLPGPERRRALARAAPALSPGGRLLAVGHARRNLDRGVGGPQDPAVLWEPGEIRAELEALGLAVERCGEVTRPVETPEGPRQALDMLVRACRPPLPPSRRG